MNGYRDYRSTQAAQWTRIDMLLALYSAAIEHIQGSIDAQQRNDSAAVLKHRLRASALVVAIRSGIDVEQSELPLKVDQLCEFVQHCLSLGEEQRLHSALRVLKELHAGFLGIRDESHRLEQAGAIPPLPTAPQLDATY